MHKIDIFILSSFYLILFFGWVMCFALCVDIISATLYSYVGGGLMKYLGSKNKIAKYILPLMLNRRESDQWWVEPFVGGANMIDKVDGKRMGNDSHPYLIALLRAVQQGWAPPAEVSRDLYYDVTHNKDQYPPELVGFVGFLCSFRGKWCGGYAADDPRNRTYPASSGSRALVKQAKNLEGIIFKCQSYLDIKIPSNSLIYCDPPYAGTTQYKGAEKFDHQIFWGWCRDKVAEGHTVFVSEYAAPDDFMCVKEVDTVSILRMGSHQRRIEKLFWYIDW